MDNAEKRIILQQLKKMFSERVRKAAVSLCRIDRETRDIFSGTLFQEAGRLFVITCSHEVPAVPRDKVWLIRDSGSFRSEGYPAILRVHRHAGDWPDIALVELDPGVLDTYLRGYEPFGKDDLGSLEYRTGQDGPQPPVTVVGNAAEEAVVRQVGKGDIMRMSIRCLLHEVVQPADWPRPLPDAHPNDPAVDIYLKSVKEGEAEPGNKKTFYSEPYGLSGGGIWDLKCDRQGISSPSDFKLVGVQARWNHKAGFLRGVRIEQLDPFMPG